MKVRFTNVAISRANPRRYRVRHQPTQRFENPPLAVQPFRLDQVEPCTRA